jgi:hypothetical protein
MLLKKALKTKGWILFDESCPATVMGLKRQPFQGVFPLWALSTRSVDT